MQAISAPAQAGERSGKTSSGVSASRLASTFSRSRRVLSGHTEPARTRCLSEGQKHSLVAPASAHVRRLSTQVSPAEEFVRMATSTGPRDACIAAVFITIGVALAFTTYDVIANDYLRKVIISSVRQHAARAAELWSLNAKQAFAGTICSEIGGVTSSIIGGLDLLRTGGLSVPQQEVLVRTRAAARAPSPLLCLVDPLTTVLEGS